MNQTSESLKKEIEEKAQKNLDFFRKLIFIGEAKGISIEFFKRNETKKNREKQ